MDSQVNDLHADKLRSDPRVVEAERLLREALQDAQAGIDGPRPPHPHRRQEYQAMLERLAAARGGPTYFPYIASGIGQGPWVELVDGSIKLDFITGIGVHGLGHSHPALLAAGLRAALEDTVMQGNLQQHRASLDIMERLLTIAQAGGAKLDHCMLTTSGAMANENALKIAFHNRHPADRVLALDNCFAGRSLATAQLTDRPLYRVGLPTALTVDYIPPEDPQHSPESRQRSLAAADKLLRRHPGKYAVLWLELVAGEGGYYPGSTEFFVQLIERVKADGALVVFDEVQTFGRLSRPFAFQHFGLDAHADIVTVGKITQLCATLYGSQLKPTAPILSQTFTAASSSIEACRTVLDELENSQCFGEQGGNVQRHEYFASRLQQLADKHVGKIAGPWGAGMMIAFTPGDGSAECARDLVHRLFDAGLMSFVAGSTPARVRFLPPPAVTTRQHIDAAIEILDHVLADWTGKSTQTPTAGGKD
ncbi:MAG: aminotransferase class III-fold pyridoxal phosphate-dependent enzyme [Planctomycetota bacterium]|nr:MAG: aminotransferase class III-fold pyridoxal phosphate-dependent enzyme [Planctomycetota bacterium]